MESLIDRQIALEDECMGLGVARYRRESTPWSSGKSKGVSESSTLPGSFLISRGLDAVAESLQAFLDDKLAARGDGKRGPKKNLKAAHWLSQFDTNVIALATLRVGVDAITGQYTLARAAAQIAMLLESQMDHDRLREANVHYYKAMTENIRKSYNLDTQRVIVRKKAKEFDVEATQLTQSDRIAYGKVALQIMMDRTGIVELKLENKPGSKRKSYMIRATPAAEEWLQSRHAEWEQMFPVLLPMLVEPKPWDGPYSGGYVTSQMTGLKLVKTSRTSYLEELRNRDLSQVYSAVNSVQNTPWRVNKGVLDVVDSLWYAGSTTAGLPPREDFPVPAKPEDIATNEEARLSWRREAAKIHEANAALVSQRASTAQKLWIAQKFADEDAIYFPHCLDWRGRMYPIPMLLHPQGDDLARGLLEFGEGVELGEDGADWLAIHVANVWGEDKVSMDNRIAWVYANEDRILDSALNPLDGDMAWASADSPFQALAAAREWLGYKMEGPSYSSHLPVALDGSCSGLQHFSAMLRDARGGDAVNLLPSDEPNDIYAEVAREVSRQVADYAADGDEMAQVWDGNIDRKTVKRPTMTQPYGVTAIGINSQTEEMLDKAKRDGEPMIDPEVKSFNAARWIGPIISQAIGEVVTAAPAVMDWLKQAARVAAKDGLPIRWETPAGFPVMHAYRKNRLKRINAWFGETYISTAVNEPLLALDTRRQAQGISPNYVHSMDASHLMLTVNRCAEHGIQDFAMIHDSFGTHAGNARPLAILLREAFVNQYRPDQLADFKAQLEAQLPPDLARDLPPLPDVGTLDIEEVRDSDYFFA